MTPAQIRVAYGVRYLNAAILLLFFSRIELPASRAGLIACSLGALAANALVHLWAEMTGRRRQGLYLLLGVDLLTVGPAVYLTGMVASPFLLVLALSINEAYYIDFDPRQAARFGVISVAWIAALFACWWLRHGTVPAWGPADHPGFVLFVFAVQVASLGAVAYQARFLPSPLIAEIARQETELARYAHRAELGTSLAMMAHEIRSPLTTVGFSLHAALDQLKVPEGPGATRALRHLQVSEQELARLNRMLDGLLAYAREKRGRMRPEPHQPLALFNRAVEFIRLKWGRHEPPFGAEAETETARAALCDPDAMHQVLVNLLDNAHQHRDPGRPLQIDLRARDRGDRIALIVRDNGIGIPAERLPGLFEPFATERRGGTGLGLSIAKELVEEQGGTLEVESLVGTGTTCTVTLPSAAPSPEPDASRPG
ncbi:MAG: HAMP domain-containing sensor histidine kinase [Candidatus Coatesbacteria bacterium]